MFAVFALCVVALALRLSKPVGERRSTTLAYGSVLAAAVALVSLGGHLGGTLVYGENFLSF